MMKLKLETMVLGGGVYKQMLLFKSKEDADRVTVNTIHESEFDMAVKALILKEAEIPDDVECMLYISHHDSFNEFYWDYYFPIRNGVVVRDELLETINREEWNILSY